MKEKMRALVICCHHPNRDPRVIWHIKSLKKRYEIDVIYTERPGVNRRLEEKADGVKFHEYSQVERPIIRSSKLRTFLFRGKNYLGSIANRYPRVYSFLITLIGFWQQRGTYESLRIAVDDLNRSFDLIIANDLDALPAGVYTRKRYGGILVFDSHENWAGVHPSTPRIVKMGINLYQRWYVKSADLITTVSPLLVECLKKDLRHKNVMLLPNAVPVDRDTMETGCSEAVMKRQEFAEEIRNIAQERLVFLFQGGVAPERGLREIVSMWRYIPINKAILVIRAPDGPNRELDRVIEMAKENGTLERSIFLLPSILEEDLIHAASVVDIGIIPYKPTFPNHVMACPNKLSQYMQAGLAIFSNNIPYVRQIVEDARCGIVYNELDGSQEMADQAMAFIEDQEKLQCYKRNAIRFAHDHFHWDMFYSYFEEEVGRLMAKNG